MREWLRKNHAMYSAMGLFHEVTVVELPRGFSVDEINRCLQNSGYVGEMVKKLAGPVQTDANRQRLIGEWIERNF